MSVIISKEAYESVAKWIQDPAHYQDYRAAATYLWNSREMRRTAAAAAETLKDLSIAPTPKEEAAIQEKLKRYFISGAIQGAGALRFGAVFLPARIRPLLEHACDATAYGLTAGRFALTQNPEHILSPSSATPKDQAYRMMNTLTAVLCVAGSLFALAQAAGLLDDATPTYKAVAQVANISFLVDMADIALQVLGLLAKRE